MLLVYLLGKITPRDPNKSPGMEYLENVEWMLHLEAELVKAGFAVINPGSDFLLPLKSRDITVEMLREVALEKMRRCDMVIALPGWRESENCMREYEEAKRLGIRITDLEHECPGLAEVNSILKKAEKEESYVQGSN